jgi:hypothetical protein
VITSRTTSVVTVAVALAASLVLVVRPSARQATPPQTAPPATPGRGGGFVPPEPLDYADHEGWTSMFDGRTLNGWEGNPQVWQVVDGAITAASTAERRVGSTHLIWRGGEPADFEWKLEYRLEGDIHSGIAYRSFTDPDGTRAGARAAQPAAGGQTTTAAPAAGAARGRGTPPQIPADPRWTLYGIGLDFDFDRQNSGNVEERGSPRREIAWRGGIVLADAGKRPRLIGSVGDAEELKALILPDGWNQIQVVARGHQYTHIINGHVMAILIDDDPTYFRASGLIGISIEQFGAGRVSARNLWIKTR